MHPRIEKTAAASLPVCIHSCWTPSTFSSSKQVPELTLRLRALTKLVPPPSPPPLLPRNCTTFLSRIGWSFWMLIFLKRRFLERIVFGGKDGEGTGGNERVQRSRGIPQPCRKPSRDQGVPTGPTQLHGGYRRTRRGGRSRCPSVSPIANPPTFLKSPSLINWFVISFCLYLQAETGQTEITNMDTRTCSLLRKDAGHRRPGLTCSLRSCLHLPSSS